MCSFLWFFTLIGLITCFPLCGGSTKAGKKSPRISLTPQEFVIEEKQIFLEEYPDAFNPSILKIEGGYVLTFRYCPNRNHDELSFLGIVELDEDFVPISDPQLLDTRFGNEEIPSHCEDPRLLALLDEIYILFNDICDTAFPTIHHPRDMFLAKIVKEGNVYRLNPPLKLSAIDRSEKQFCEKNWVPFVWEDKLLLSYYPSPHEVLLPDLVSGKCSPLFSNRLSISWDFGEIRGGTPAIAIDGEYFAFFHSRLFTKSPASPRNNKYHYFMGAYSFSSNPPFELISATTKPIVGKTFYDNNRTTKHVIFPTGIIAAGPLFYVIYGKDDCEMWVATIDRLRLKMSMEPVQE